MKCSFEEADFRPAWKAMMPPAAKGDHLDAWDDPTWHDDIIRVEVAGGALKMQGPYGTVSVPAEVETPGVLFMRIQQFIDAFAESYGDTTLTLEAEQEFVDIHRGRHFARFVPMELFDDPATAPDTFVPEKHVYEYDDDADADLADDDAARPA